MRSPEPGLFEAIPISDKVNKVANMGADLQERVEAGGEEPEPRSKPADARQLSLF